MSSLTGEWTATHVKHDRNQWWITLDEDSMEVFGAYLGRLMMTDRLFHQTPYRSIRAWVGGGLAEPVGETGAAGYGDIVYANQG